VRFSKLIHLSRVLLWREVRSGQMNIIILALLLAVTSATVISVFSSRLDAGMLDKSTELLGADLRVRSNAAIPPSFYQQAKLLGLKTTTTLEFPSVVVAGNMGAGNMGAGNEYAGDEMALAAIKAVDKGYPLKGSVTISNTLSSEGNVVHAGPKPGEIWLESRLFALLNTKIGDQVEVGRKTFHITAVILKESDRGGNFYSLSPRLMMNLNDVEAAGLVQVGSRVTWRLLASQANANDHTLDDYKAWLVPQIESFQNIESLSDNNLAMSGALKKARSYLSLAAILAILLSGIAIAMAARDYAQHHFDTSALLRTLGASRAQVLTLFILQLIYLAVVTSMAGLLLGTGIQELLVEVLRGLFSNNLPPAEYSAWVIAAATAPFTLIGFALPHLLRLGRVSPLRILRRELEPMSWNIGAVYGLAMAAIFALSFWFTDNLLMSAIVVFGGFVVLIILLFLVQLLLRIGDKIVPTHRINLVFRFAWQHIIRDTRSTSTQILAFSIILMVMMVINNVRTDLLADWQKSLPDDAPNYFAMNIQHYEIEPYQKALDTAGFGRKPLFPMVLGRLTKINQQRVQDNESINQDPALQRDLALTWDKTLPEGNKLIEGKWFTSDSGDNKQVSVEARLASRLGIEMNDSLTFEVASESFEASVTSLRYVDWATLNPNFYMIFSADVLQHLPASYLTSFHIPKDKQDQLTPLIRSFPTITLLDMSMVFKQIQGLLAQVASAVQYLLILVLLAGLVVLMATLHSSLDERIQQGAVLRTLGASKAQLRASQWSEFALLGFIAGLIAVAGTDAICFFLYNKLFELDYHIKWPLWVGLPLASSTLIMLFGAFTTRKVTQRSPITVLREI